MVLLPIYLSTLLNMPLLAPVTTTAQYLQQLMDMNDVATVIQELANQDYDNADICIQNNWVTDVRAEYWKDAIPTQCHRIGQWGSLTLRIIFNETNLNYYRLSLIVGTGTNSNVTYIILPSLTTT